MQFSDRYSDVEIQEFCATLVERGRVVVQGLEALRLLRLAVERAHHEAGVVVEWDPSSSIDLSGWFGLVSLCTVRWAIAGGALGLLLFGLTDKSELGAIAGLGVGAAIGALQGHRAVRSGWRLRGYLDERGAVVVEVKVRPVPSPLRALMA